jgi:pimeloyl-ACP methyl ester carboxylesterase
VGTPRGEGGHEVVGFLVELGGPGRVVGAVLLPRRLPSSTRTRAALTLHSYRVRWGEGEPDPAYADIEARRRSARTISVPTLVIQGGDDRCSSAAMSEQ